MPDYDHINHENKARVMRAWVKRRQDKGVWPNADEIWNHINKSWPMLPEDQREWIFQSATVGRFPSPSEKRVADRVNGYDRDDLGESPDY